MRGKKQQPKDFVPARQKPSRRKERDPEQFEEFAGAEGFPSPTEEEASAKKDREKSAFICENPPEEEDE